MGTAAFMAISAGLQLMQGIQGYQQGKAMAKQQGAITAANIQTEQNRLAIERDQLKKQQEKARGSQRVAAAATGATLGSFDDVMAESTEASLMDLALLEYDSKVNQESMRYEGGVRQQEYKSQARSSLLKGIAGAASSGYQAYGASGIGASKPLYSYSPSGTVIPGYKPSRGY